MRFEWDKNKNIENHKNIMSHSRMRARPFTIRTGLLKRIKAIREMRIDGIVMASYRMG